MQVLSSYSKERSAHVNDEEEKLPPRIGGYSKFIIRIYIAPSS